MTHPKPPPDVIETMARALNDRGWRDPAKIAEEWRDLQPAWRAKAVAKVARVLTAAEAAGWVLVPHRDRPHGLGELEGVVRATEPKALVMLPAAYVLEMIEAIDGKERAA